LYFGTESDFLALYKQVFIFIIIKVTFPKEFLIVVKIKYIYSLSGVLLSANLVEQLFKAFEIHEDNTFKID
jgi:hypothetical protein